MIEGPSFIFNHPHDEELPSEDLTSELKGCNHVPLEPASRWRVMPGDYGL